MSQFTAPAFSPEALAASARVYQEFTRLRDTRWEGQLDDQDPADLIREHPEYARAFPALGTNLAFCFPRMVYDNDTPTPPGLDDPIGDCCVRFFDPSPGSDELFPDELLTTDRMEAAGLYALDETTYEFTDKSRTLRQCVQSLLDMGIRYVPVDPGAGAEEYCLFQDELTAAGAQSPDLQAAPSIAAPGPG